MPTNPSRVAVSESGLEDDLDAAVFLLLEVGAAP
jgi:hypothetical protein